jgi:hypothetical protein
VVAMYRSLVVVCLAATGCGFGFGAVDGASREYAMHEGGGYTRDSGGQYVDSDGQRWRYAGGPFIGNATLGVGLLLGFRRGYSWSHYGAGSEGGRTADYHMTGYYGAFSLGLGYTTDTGSVAIPYDAMTLAGSVGYHGWYLEPALALYANGPIYLGATVALINGSTHLQLATQSSAGEQDALGIRPGLRLAVGILPVGPVTLKLSVDVRYLMTQETTLVTGGGTTPESYGGLSSAVSLSFVL